MKIQSNIKQFAEQIKHDFTLWQTGCAEGVAAVMADGIRNTLEQGFVPGPRRIKYQYPVMPGANIADKTGKLKFVNGKVVDRTGTLSADLKDLEINQLFPNPDARDGTVGIGTNGRSTLRLDRIGGTMKATLMLPDRLAWKMLQFGNGQGDTRILLGDEKPLDTKKGQRRVIQRGFATTCKVWNKIVQGKLDKWLKRVGDK